MLLGRPVTKNISGRGRVRRPTASARDRYRRRGDRVRRREFMLILGGAMTMPLPLRAQQKAMPVVGYLSSGSPNADTFSAARAAFLEGLREKGYADGRNVVIEYRLAEGHLDRLPALAAELVSRKVDVIVSTGGTTGAVAAKGATSTIPIIFI